MNLTLALTLENRAATQYTGWNFDSVCTFNGKTLAVGDDGLFTLEGDTDNGSAINARAELPLIDLGRETRLRRIAAAGEFPEGLLLTVSADEGAQRSYQISPRKGGRVQQGAETTIGRDGKGRFWKLVVESSKFCLDGLTLYPVALSRKPRG